MIHYSLSAANKAKDVSIAESGGSKTNGQEAEMIHYLRVLAARLRGSFDGRKAAQELDEEIEGRLRLLAERYVRQGMTEAERAGEQKEGFGLRQMPRRELESCERRRAP